MTTKIQGEMIEEFQCPGCVAGSYPKCLELYDDGKCFYCKRHVLGTCRLGIGSWALGLPKGFCRPGKDTEHIHFNKIPLRLWESPEKIPVWDTFNIACWALEQEGYLFVRTYMPRINQGMTDVIRGGTRAMVPAAIDVAPFLDEMD